MAPKTLIEKYGPLGPFQIEFLWEKKFLEEEKPHWSKMVFWPEFLAVVVVSVTSVVDVVAAAIHLVTVVNVATAVAVF